MSDRALTINSLSSVAAIAIVIFALPWFPAAGQSVFPEPKTPSEMTELAHKYANGIGCPRDAGQAMLWYKRAAHEGDPGAMVAIGDMLQAGRRGEHASRRA